MLSFLKRLSPNFIKTLARNIRSRLYSILDFYKPYLIYRTYCGFKLFYTQGSGLVNRIRFGNPDKIYEHTLVNLLIRELSKHESPVFLDAGTNIGLISLAILKYIPEVKIFGFEPGPVPYKSFSTTIFANQIENKIILLNEALNNKPGQITFYKHDDKDSSGDGMIDTRRANSLSTAIIVKANTLDNWSKENNISKVDVIKMDIEGAELYALQGSVEFLKKYKPTIFLEISIENLKVYPYKEKEILEFFELNDYVLFDIDDVKCTPENISMMVIDNDTFIAKPNK